MPSFEQRLSEEDRWNILNFLRDQFGNPPSQASRLGRQCRRYR